MTVSPADRTRLANTLTVSITADLDPDPERGAYPRGAVDYEAQYLVSWSPQWDVDLSSDTQRELRAIATRVNVPTDDECVRVPVGYGRFVVVDLHEPLLMDALDAREGDLKYLASRVCRGGSDDSLLADGLEDIVEYVGGYAVLVNEISVAEAFRGAGIGLRATGAVLAEIGRGCSFAALHAMQPGVRDSSSRHAAHRALSKYWQRLAFQPWRDETMVLSFGLVHFEAARARLEMRIVD